MYQFPRAVIAEYHKLSSINNKNVLSHSSRGQERNANGFSHSLSLGVILPGSPHSLPSVCDSVSKCPLSVSRESLSHLNDLNVCKKLISKKRSHLQALGVRTPISFAGEGNTSTQNRVLTLHHEIQQHWQSLPLEFFKKIKDKDN